MGRNRRMLEAGANPAFFIVQGEYSKLLERGGETMYQVLMINEYDEMIGKAYKTREAALEQAEKMAENNPHWKVYVNSGPGPDDLSLFHNKGEGDKFGGKPWGKLDPDYVRIVKGKYYEYRAVTHDRNTTFEEFAIRYERGEKLPGLEEGLDY